MKDKNIKIFLERLHTPDGGFILDDSLPEIKFSDPDDSIEKRKEIESLNKINLEKYIHGE